MFWKEISFGENQNCVNSIECLIIHWIHLCIGVLSWHMTLNLMFSKFTLHLSSWKDSWDYCKITWKCLPERWTWPLSGSGSSGHSFSGLIHDIPHRPSQRHNFLLFWQLLSDKHLVMHFNPWALAASSFLHSHVLIWILCYW